MNPLASIAQSWLNRLAFALLWTVVFTIPFDDIIGLPGFGTLSRLLGYAALFAALGDVLSRGRCQGVRGPAFWVLAFVAFALLSVMWTSSISGTIDKVPTVVRSLGLFWLIYEFADGDRRTNSLLQAYVLGGWVCIGGLAQSLLSGTFVDDSDYTRYVVGQMDPNDLAAMLAIGVPIAWHLSSFTTSRGLKWANLLYIPLALLSVLLTASRGGSLTMIVALAFVAMSFPRLKAWTKIAVILSVVLMIAAAVAFVPDTAWMRFTSISDEVSGGTFANRTVIWRAGFTFLHEHLLLGLGVGAFKEVVFNQGGYFKPIVAHSVFLGVLFDLGVIGCVLFAAIVVSLFRHLRLVPVRTRRFFQFLLLTWIVAGLSLSLEYRKVTWFLLGVIAAVVARAPFRFLSRAYEPEPEA